MVGIVALRRCTMAGAGHWYNKPATVNVRLGKVQDAIDKLKTMPVVGLGTSDSF